MVKAIAAAPDLTLIGAIDRNPAFLGEDAGEVAGCGELEVPILADRESTLVMAAQEK